MTSRSKIEHRGFTGWSKLVAVTDVLRSRPTSDAIGAALPAQCVVPSTPADAIVTAAAEHLVLSGASKNYVVPRGSLDALSTGTSLDRRGATQASFRGTRFCTGGRNEARGKGEEKAGQDQPGSSRSIESARQCTSQITAQLNLHS